MRKDDLPCTRPDIGHGAIIAQAVPFVNGENRRFSPKNFVKNPRTKKKRRKKWCFLSILHIQSEKGAAAPQNAGARYAGQAGQRESPAFAKKQNKDLHFLSIYFLKSTGKNRKDML